MLKKLFVIIMMLLNSLCFAQIKGNSKDLIVEKLDNGMTYYFYKNKKPENRVSINILVKAGSLQEKENQRGLAHFLEHMCFNGTENYKKNSIIKYFESIGLSFGGDLNAHTGFYETVYKLNLPTDDRNKFQKGIEILYEMVFKATLNQEDIDSEGKIIKEEWRLGQGLSDRVYKQVYQKAVFKDSKYEKRRVIGDMAVVESAKTENMKEFYYKWYHPENMAIVVVGDVDKKYLDGVVKKYFNKKIERKYTVPKKYPLKELKDNYIIFKDKEIKVPEFQITYRKDRTLVYDEKYFKKIVGKTLVKRLFKNRCYRELGEGNTSLLDVDLSNDVYMKDFNESIYGLLSEGQEKKAIKTIYDNLRYLGEQPIGKEELELEKKDILNGLSILVKNKDSIHSGEIIEKINKVFITDGIFLSPREVLEIYRKYLNEIDSLYIGALAREIYNDNGSYILILPEKQKEVFKNKEEFKLFMEKLKDDALKEKEFITGNIKLEEVKLQKGSISSVKNRADYKELTLSNGMEVLYKETKFKKNEILISLFKEEGTSIENYRNYLNTFMGTSIILDSGVGNIGVKDLNSYMKGKNFSVVPYISEYKQGIDIISTKEDLNEALKYFLNAIKNPKIDDNIYNINMETLRNIIINRKNSSRDVFQDKVTEILYKNNPRKKFITEEDLNKITKEGILTTYKKKFSDFKDYKIVVVSSIKEEKLKDILEKYFAALPVNISNEANKIKYNIQYPEGIVSENVVKGIDKKIKVNIFYPIKVKYNQENKYLGKSIAKILEISLTENIREKMGGVYGISVNTKMNKFEPSLLVIQFSTDPKKELEVRKGIENEVEKINKGKIDLKTLNSVKENYRNIYESLIKENYYWKIFLENKILEKEKYEKMTPEKYNVLVSEERLSEFGKKFIDKGNYINIILKPEKEKK